MIEIFSDIGDDIKEIAKTSWKLALMQKEPRKAAEFLTRVIDYCKQLYTEEEIEFLQFYFQTQMEMVKND